MTSTETIKTKIGKTNTLKKRVSKYKYIYLMMLPGILYYIIFHYIPMYGIIISFQNFRPFQGISGMFINPEWVGLKNFTDFFKSYYFFRLIRNTLLISFYRLIFMFPLAIVLALLINEVRNRYAKKIIQTISYMPHFLSWVIISGLVITLLSPTSGAINELRKSMGLEAIAFLGEAKYFRTIITVAGIWRSIGWSSIIYLAALTSVSNELYESASLEGATRIQQMFYISLPAISDVIIIVFILNLGKVMDGGFEKVLLLYSPGVYETGDIIDTYVYREGIKNMRYSYAAAVGLFKNIIGMILVLSTDRIAKIFGKEGIW